MFHARYTVRTGVDITLAISVYWCTYSSRADVVGALDVGLNKLRLCVEGSRMIADYCKAKGIPYQKISKLVITINEKECEFLSELGWRAQTNGAPARLIEHQEVQEIEPHVQGLAGLHSLEDEIIDLRRFVQPLAQDTAEAGVKLKLDHRIVDARKEKGYVRIRTNRNIYIYEIDHQQHRVSH